MNIYEVADHWYLEAADFLGVFCLGEERYPAWKEAEMHLGATEKGRALLGSRKYPFQARTTEGVSSS